LFHHQQLLDLRCATEKKESVIYCAVGLYAMATNPPGRSRATRPTEAVRDWWQWLSRWLNSRSVSC